ncbi:MAG: FAD-binding protein [Thermoplasmata archaeon]|nr:FAD-binding protein [Thermoplasmata archaeon]
MDFAVLVKVVPAVEQLRFDPERKTMIRAGVQSFVNPHDSRAVRVAVQLRRPGERVSVFSMGPPETTAPLRESFAWGADRVVLVSDRLLAGSDTLVTARVLKAALGPSGHDIVLAGERSVDSDTGQVGPEVAALLDVPVLTATRNLTRAAEGDVLESVNETETGWNRFRFSPPAVVTVNERILRKLPPPTVLDRARALQMTVEVQGIRDLGLFAEHVGLGGSPTVVRAVENEEPDRRPRVFAEGELAARIDAAGMAVEELLNVPPPRPVPLPPISTSLRDDREVLVLVSGPLGAIETACLGVLSELRRWGSRVWPSAAWVGRAPSEAEQVDVARFGAARGYLVPTGGSYVGSRTAALGLDHLLTLRPGLAGVVVLATPFGRAVAGQLAARRGLGLTGDAVGLLVDAAGALVWRKPAFGGGLVASILSRTRPSLATVRPGAMTRSEDRGARTLSVQETPPVVSGHEPELVESGSELEAKWGDLTVARVVVVVGMGLGGPERLPELRPTLERWNAALGATRRVVDAGWLPGSRQVGLTGRSLAADLAVLVGVSGATNQLVGLRRTRVLLAVNTDPAAPVFQRVDVGIVGGWPEVIPRLTDRLAAVARGRTVAPG